MKLQLGAQTSGNDWRPSYSNQRAYRDSQPHVGTIANLAYGQTFFGAIERDMADSRASQQATMRELQRRFGKANDPFVVTFLANHRAVPHLLVEAWEGLKEAFGANVVVNLEVSTDEDGHQTLRAVTLWKEDAAKAAIAFHSFVENWWLDRMNASNSDVAFVYRFI